MAFEALALETIQNEQVMQLMGRVRTSTLALCKPFDQSCPNVWFAIAQLQNQAPVFNKPNIGLYIVASCV